MNKILILGSNSFSGNHLVNFLIEKDMKVIGCSLSAESPKRFNTVLNEGMKKRKNFIFHRININKNFKKLKVIIKKYKPEIIVDFLGQGMVDESWQYPELTFNTNVIGKIKLYDFLKKEKFLKKYIKISTPEVFGSSKIKSSNFDQYNPSTPYALSHSTIEKYLLLINKQFSFPVIIARFANFYGPYQKLYRVIPLAIHKASKKEIFKLHGGGSSRRSFIFSKDFCNGIFKMIKKGKPGEFYQFSSKEYNSIKEIVNMIYKKYKLDPKKYIKNVSDRPGKDKDYKINDRETRKKLKWNNNYNLQMGVNETIEWYKSYENQFDVKDEKFIIKK
jgi:dTDP-glucose 4,6-dehydratase